MGIEFPLIDKRFFRRSGVLIAAETIRECMKSVGNDRKEFIDALSADEEDGIAIDYEEQLEQIAVYDFVMAELAQVLSDIHQRPLIKEIQGKRD